MPFGLQPIHLVVVFVVALLIFGPRRLPDIGRGVGKAINEFRKGTQEMTESLREEISKPGHEASLATADSQPPAMAPQPSAQAAPVQPAPAPAAIGNFCSNCGSANSAEARFCNKCGTQLAA